MRVLLILSLALAIGAEESVYDRLRPQPRQIFREGFKPGNGEQTPRRPSLRDLRDRREGLATTRFRSSPPPITSFPSEAEEHQPPKLRINAVEGEARNFDRSSFPRPRGPPVEVEESQQPETDVPDYLGKEELQSEVPDYVDDEEYSTDQIEPALNYVDEEDETRSPSHRYPDEEYTTPSFASSAFPDFQLSSLGEEKDAITPVPLLENEFSPFAMFKSDEDDEVDPPEAQSPDEQFLESSSKFEFAANPFRGNRFSSAPAQERTYETNAPQVRAQRPQRKAFDRRPTPGGRLPARRPYSSPSNPNSISQDSFYEEHQKRLPPRQPSPSEDLDYYSDDYENEPDRLSELLLQSEFSCVGRKDGYYADEFVDCEVFHFCQDNVKHSWLCPNGAAFHQVHLICLPRSEDNICAKSSKFHFVNDFLYKEVGEDPENRSYVERYYPQGYESGIANIPDHDGRVPPPAVSKTPYHRPRGEQHPAPPPSYRGRPSQFRGENEERIQQIGRPDERRQHQQQPPQRSQFRQRQERPVFREVEEKPSFFEAEGPKPSFLESRRPSFQAPQQESFERPVFEVEEEETRQPEEGHKFRPFHLEEPSQPRPLFEHASNRGPPPPPQGDFEHDGPSAHFQSSRPRPSSAPQFEERERRPSRHPQPIPLETHDPPIYRPQPTIYRAPPLKLQSLQSVKRLQFRPAPEGRQHSLMEGPSLSPFFQLG